MQHFYRNPLNPTAVYIDEMGLDLETFNVSDFGAQIRTIGPKATRLRLSLPSAKPAPRGWQKIKETRLRKVPLDQVTPRPTSARVVRKGAAGWRDFVLAHDRYYRAAHQDNPVAPLNFDQMQKIFADEDLIEDCAFAVFEEDTIRVFGSLRDIDVPNKRAEAGWVGAANLHDEFGFSEIFAAIFQSATCLELTHIEVEADTTHPALWWYVDRLPCDGEDRFVTWEQRL